MSVVRATELINSSIVLLRILGKRVALDFNIRETQHKLIDIENVLLEAKEELKDYKL